MRVTTWLRRAALASVLVSVAGLGAIVVWLPAAAAFACPRCYGFSLAGPNIHVEDGTPDPAKARLVADVETAAGRVAAFYRDAVSPGPVVLACFSAACDERLGKKGGKGHAYGSTFVHLSADAWNATILAHELAHIELHARIGMHAMISGALPAWFDEGLAVIVSKDGRYVGLDADGEAVCTVAWNGDLPTTRRDWNKEAGRHDRPIYAMSACRVLDWLERHGGPPAVAAIAGKLRSGEAFRE